MSAAGGFGGGRVMFDYIANVGWGLGVKEGQVDEKCAECVNYVRWGGVVARKTQKSSREKV